MDSIDGVIFYPWDISYFCRKSLNAIKPRIYIIIQHDYSLKFLKEAKKYKVKTVIMSGFIRPGEMPEYDSFHYKRAFAGQFLNYIDYLGVQSNKDKIIFSQGLPPGIDKPGLQPADNIPEALADLV